MKRRRLFLIAMAMFVVSCHSEIAEPKVVGAPSVDDPVSIYAISEEEAIENLNEFLAAFDVEDTRVNSRVVKSIEPVKLDNLGVTRTSSDVDIDNLLYIVEFEDGQGSAVLGADRRLTPVYAVLDESVLTKEDFQNVVNGENIEDVSTFTAGLIAQDAMNSISTCDLGMVDLRTDITYYTTTTTLLSKVFPMLNTKWGQGPPYNDRFPLKSNGLSREEAGCGTIAVAQVLTYLTYPNNITLNGHSHDWSIITKFTYWGEENTDIYDKNCLSLFIYDLALEMNVDFGDGGEEDLGSYVPVEESEALFERLGYKNVNFESLTTAKAYNMIWNNKPFYAYGIDTRHVEVPTDVAHAWVIDGWKETETVVRKIVEDNGIIISNTIYDEYTTQYAHCNFGWNGKCDGYYTFTMFNTLSLRPNDMIETTYGDVIGIDRWFFTHNFNMIKYDY